MHGENKDLNLSRSLRKYLLASFIPWVVSIGLITLYLLEFGSDEYLIIKVPFLGLLLGLFAASSRDFFRRLRDCLSYRIRH